MQEENIHIRWANGNDAEDLLKLNDAFNGVGTTLEEVKESLALSNELIALAVIDGQAVGFACAQYFKSFVIVDSRRNHRNVYCRSCPEKRIGYVANCFYRGGT